VPIARLDSQASDATIRQSVEAAVARGKLAVPGLLIELRSEIATRRRAAGAALAKLSGRDFGYDPGRPPSEQGEALRAAEAWWAGEAEAATSGK